MPFFTEAHAQHTLRPPHASSANQAAYVTEREGERFFRSLKRNESAHFSFSLCTLTTLPPSSPVPPPSLGLLQRFRLVRTLTRPRDTEGCGENAGIVYRRAHARDQSARRAELGGRRYLLAPPSPAFPASGRASASVSLFLIFSPFPLSFLFFFPLPPLPPFPLGGASPGQGQSRPHPAPLPGPRRPMARGRPLLTRAPAAAVGGAGPAAAAASGPGSSWN